MAEWVREWSAPCVASWGRNLRLKEASCLHPHQLSAEIKQGCCYWQDPKQARRLCCRQSNMDDVGEGGGGERTQFWCLHIFLPHPPTPLSFCFSTPNDRFASVFILESHAWLLFFFIPFSVISVFSNCLPSEVTVWTFIISCQAHSFHTHYFMSNAWLRLI